MLCLQETAIRNHIQNPLYCKQQEEENIAKGTTDPGVDNLNQLLWFGLVGLVQQIWLGLVG